MQKWWFVKVDNFVLAFSQCTLFARRWNEEPAEGIPSCPGGSEAYPEYPTCYWSIPWSSRPKQCHCRINNRIKLLRQNSEHNRQVGRFLIVTIMISQTSGKPRAGVSWLGTRVCDRFLIRHSACSPNSRGWLIHKITVERICVSQSVIAVVKALQLSIKWRRWCFVRIQISIWFRPSEHPTALAYWLTPLRFVRLLELIFSPTVKDWRDFELLYFRGSLRARIRTPYVSFP